MAGKHRIERVGEQVKQELAQLIQFELNDPRIGMVTLTEVEVSSDLSYAKIYFTLLDETEKAETLKGLKAASGFLRKQLAGRMRNMRITPELHFQYDVALAQANHLMGVIDAAVAADRKHESQPDQE